MLSVPARLFPSVARFHVGAAVNRFIAGVWRDRLFRAVEPALRGSAPAAMPLKGVHVVKQAHHAIRQMRHPWTPFSVTVLDTYFSPFFRQFLDADIRVLLFT